MLVQSFQIRPNSHYVHFLQPLLFIISATATTGYVKIPSNFYHQLPIPQCLGPPRGVKFVCISPPGNRVINFPFIYQELLPKRKSFIGCDLWEEREKGLISWEGERRQRKGRESCSFCCSGQMEDAKFPRSLMPSPPSRSWEDPIPPTPGLSQRVNHMWACRDCQMVGPKVAISPFSRCLTCLGLCEQVGQRTEVLGCCWLFWVTGGWGSEVEGGGYMERREPSTPPSYLCIRDILWSSMSSLPRNPLAKGLFSIFNWVIWRKEREKERLRVHLMAGNAASGNQKQQIKPVTAVGPTTSFERRLWKLP